MGDKAALADFKKVSKIKSLFQCNELPRRYKCTCVYKRGRERKRDIYIAMKRLMSPGGLL